MTTALIETLRDAQRLGFFGPAPIEVAVAHAESFVAALGELTPGSRTVDLGSGGGLPGLVLADRYPLVSLLLVDRRRKRTDFLERAVRRLHYTHVAVYAGEAAGLQRSVATGDLDPFDVVTARGFGPPEPTLRLACQLVSRGGRIVISEPPDRQRWDAELLSELGLSAERRGAVQVFTRFT